MGKGIHPTEFCGDKDHIRRKILDTTVSLLISCARMGNAKSPKQGVQVGETKQKVKSDTTKSLLFGVWLREVGRWALVLALVYEMVPDTRINELIVYMEKSYSGA